jgi:hypothetical protein
MKTFMELLPYIVAITGLTAFITMIGVLEEIARNS